MRLTKWSDSVPIVSHLKSLHVYMCIESVVDDPKPVRYSSGTPHKLYKTGFTKPTKTSLVFAILGKTEPIRFLFKSN